MLSDKQIDHKLFVVRNIGLISPIFFWRKLFPQACISMSTCFYFSANLSCWYLLNLGSPLCRQGISLESAAFFLQLNSFPSSLLTRKKHVSVNKIFLIVQLFTHICFLLFQKLLSAAIVFCVNSASSMSGHFSPRPVPFCLSAFWVACSEMWLYHPIHISLQKYCLCYGL